MRARLNHIAPDAAAAEITVADRDVVAINDLYQKARGCLIDSIRFAINA